MLIAILAERRFPTPDIWHCIQTDLKRILAAEQSTLSREELSQIRNTAGDAEYQFLSGDFESCLHIVDCLHAVCYNIDGELIDRLALDAIRSGHLEPSSLSKETFTAASILRFYRALLKIGTLPADSGTRTQIKKKFI